MTKADKNVLWSWVIAVSVIASFILIGFQIDNRLDASDERYEIAADYKTAADNNPTDKGYDYIRNWTKKAVADGYISNGEFNDLMDEEKDIEKQNRINRLAM